MKSDFSILDKCSLFPNPDGITIPKPILALHHSASTVINSDTLWITGGYYYDQEDEKYYLPYSTSYFNISTLGVELGPTSPFLVWKHCLLSFEISDKAILIGGIDISEDSNKTYIFDFLSGHWEVGPSLNIIKGPVSCGYIQKLNGERLIIVTGEVETGKIYLKQ